MIEGGDEFLDQVLFAAGAVESGDQGRFVELFVDRGDELGR